MKYVIAKFQFFCYNTTMTTKKILPKIFITLLILSLITACAQDLYEYESDYYAIDRVEGDSDNLELIDDTEPDEPSPYGTLNLRIAESRNSLPLPFASVFVDFPNEPLLITADENGEVSIEALYGSYSISAFMQNYLPKEETFEIVQGSVVNATIHLIKGNVIETELIPERLSLNEITAIGIDATDLMMGRTHNFELSQSFHSRTLRRRTASADSPEIAETTPNVTHMRLICSVSFLDDFFELTVTIENIMGSTFEILDSTFTLNLPQGISLAENTSQSPDVRVDSLQGSEDISLSWLLRADNDFGSSNSVSNNAITLNHTGILMPFEEPVEFDFTIETALFDNAARELSIIFHPFDAASPNAPYYIPFTVRNDSDIPINMVRFNFEGQSLSRNPNEAITTRSGGRSLALHSLDDMQNFELFQCGDSILVHTLKPGDEFAGTYKTFFNDSTNPSRAYFALRDSQIQALSGNTDSIVISIDATIIEISVPASSLMRMIEDFIIRHETQNLVNTNVVFSTNEHGRFFNFRGEHISQNHFNHNRGLDFSRCSSACREFCVPSVCQPKPGFSSEGFIINQTIGVPGEAMMGSPMLGSNACGWVAVFNSLKILDFDMSDKHPSEIIRWIESNNALIMDGTLGTNPAIFDRLFNYWGINTHTTFASQGIFCSRYLDMMVKSSTSSILNYVNRGGIRSGIHNVTVVWDDNASEFVFYNVGAANEQRPIRRRSINAFLDDFSDSLISVTQVFD